MQYWCTPVLFCCFEQSLISNHFILILNHYVHFLPVVPNCVLIRIAIMEFQAVVMAAGKGSRMTELTSGSPKCLLPVGNIPLVWYPLNMLQKAGFQEAILIVPEFAKIKVQEALQDKCDLKLEIIPISQTEEWGTADSLRFIKDKIKGDIVVVSCDLITDFALHQLADLHRTHDASLTMLLAPVSSSLKDAPVPGPKGKHRQEKDIVGINPSSGRLVMVNSEADFEEDVPFKISVLKRHSVVQVYSNLMDAHLYIIKKGLVDFLVENEHISTIKGELLPVLVKKQFKQKPKTQCQKKEKGQPPSLISESFKRDIYSCIGENEQNIALELSTWSDQWGTLNDPYHGDVIRCYACIMEDGFCMRANNIVSYGELNRQVTRVLYSLTGDQHKPPRLVDLQKPQISNDSLMCEDVEIAEKVSVKRSVIGSHCKIKEKVKILNSTIMDHVTVEEGCCIQGSIICSNAQIGQKSEIKDCIVGQGQHIEDSSKLTNEVLQDDRMMEI